MRYIQTKQKLNHFLAILALILVLSGLPQAAFGQAGSGSAPATKPNALNSQNKFQLSKQIQAQKNSEQNKGLSKSDKDKSINDYLLDMKNWFITTGLQVVVILVTTMVAMFFSNLLSKKLFNLVVKDRADTELKKRATTLSTVTRYIMLVGILAIGGMMVLRKLGIDIAPLLAGAGVLGIAIGFGAQNIIKDLISGSFILLEDQIRVGDVIEIGNKNGIVEKVTLRMVVLRDLSGNVHFIPSGDIQVVTNMTKTFSRYLFDIGIAYKEDTDEVIELMKAVDKELREEDQYKDKILEPLEIMGVDRFESSAVVIRARTKTLPGKQWSVGREFNRRFKQSFDKNGIEIPFPHMTVYQGVDKSGESSPVNLNIMNSK